MLSRRPDITKGENECSRPLLRLAMLESCELVCNDASLIKSIKIATNKDETLQPILAFLSNNPGKAPIDARRRFQDYKFLDGILYFREKKFVPHDQEMQRQILKS